MAAVKESCFKYLGAINLKQPTANLEVSHTYSVIGTVVSNQLHLISAAELIKGNSSAFVNTNINAHLIASNEEVLAVANNNIVTLYSYTDFKNPIAVVNTKSKVKKLQFNPTENYMLAILSDQGNLLLVRVSNKGVENFTLNENKVTALCFSPKGKQLCVGHRDGHLSQLKLDLTIAKRIDGSAGVPLSVLWVATTQFLVLFLHGNDFLLFQVDVQKGNAPPLYNNIGDVFIADPEMVNLNSEAFFSTHSADTIVCSSTTSNEVVLLGKSESLWVVSNVQDDRRANLPMDNFCVGAHLYYSHPAPVSFAENETYGPMPVYILASQQGVISLYSLVNRQGKGDGIKFEAGQTPLNLASISFGVANVPPPPPVQIPAITTKQQPSAFTFAPLALATTSSQPLFSAPSSSVPSQKPAQSNVAAQGATTPIQGFGHALQKVESQGNINQALLAESTKPQQSASSVPITKSETKAPPTEAQINELKEKAKALRDSELSAALLKQVAEFETRLAKFQKLKAEQTENWNNQLNLVTGKIETEITGPMNRLEDFVHNIENNFRDQKKEVEGLMERHVTHFESLEYAKTLDERNKDPKYIEALRSQPLDPMIAKKFKNIEKTVGYIRSQIQECRKHFYFSKCPPLSPEDTVKLIYQTLATNDFVIRKLKIENSLIREKLGLNKGLDDLTASLKNTTLNESSARADQSISLDRIDEVKKFLARRNIVKLKNEHPDSFYAEGDLRENVKFEEEKKTPKRAPSYRAASLKSDSKSDSKNILPISPIMGSSQSTFITTPPKTVQVPVEPKESISTTKAVPSTTNGTSSLFPTFITPAPGLFSFGPPVSKNAIQPTVLFPQSTSTTTASSEPSSMFRGLGTTATTTSLFGQPKDSTAVTSESVSPFVSLPALPSGLTITSVTSLAKPEPEASAPNQFSFSTAKPFLSTGFGTKANVATSAIDGTGDSASVASAILPTSTATGLPGLFSKATSTLAPLGVADTTTALGKPTSTGFTFTASNAAVPSPESTTARPTATTVSSTAEVKPAEVKTTASPNLFQVKATSPAAQTITQPASSTPLVSPAVGSSGTINVGGTSLFTAFTSTTVTAVPTLISSLPSTTLFSQTGSSFGAFTLPTDSTPTTSTATPGTVTLTSSAVGAESATTTAPATNIPAASVSTQSPVSQTSAAATPGSVLTAPSSVTPAATTLGSVLTAPSSVTPAAATLGSTQSATAFSGFGTPTSTTSGSNIFKTDATPSALSSFSFKTPAFGSSPLETPATTPATAPATNSSGLFSEFGNVTICSPTTATASPSLFGSGTNTSTETSFGSSSIIAPANIFGGNPSTPAGTGAAASIFGAPPNVQSPPGASIFGTPSQAASPFGNTSSIFGGSSFGTTAASAGSPFGSAAASGSGTTSIFGGSSTLGSSTLGSSPFGSTAAAPGTTSIFGAASGAATPAAAGSIFGGSSLFGGGNAFGGGSFTQQQPKPAESIFGGSAFSGLGYSQPVGEVKNVFGGGSTFGTQPAAQNLFASAGSPAQSSAFGSIAAKPVNPAFGAPSVFGSSLSTFGSAPVFGGGAVFGSSFSQSSPGSTGTGSIFGGGSVQQNVGFGQLAQQNSSTGIFGGGVGDTSSGAFGASSSPFGAFGSQQPQQQQQQQQSSFGSAPSFASWR